MKIIERAVSTIIRNTGLSGINDKQKDSIILVLKDDDLSLDDKITLVMEELSLKGSLYRKDIYDALEFYIDLLNL